MTPKQKANQLVKQYIKIYTSPYVKTKKEAAQCAITLVTSICKEHEDMHQWVKQDVKRMKDIGFYLIGRQRFWEGVKYELEQI